MRRFGLSMINEDWEEVRQEDSPTKQEEALQALLTRKLDKCLPTKTVRLRNTDKPYITKEIKILDRKRKREYKKHSKSYKYLQLNRSYENKLKAATVNYLNRNVRELMETQPGKAYNTLKRLGAQPGDSVEAGSFRIPEHTQLGLTVAQSADRIAEKFAAISQEYPVLKMESLPTRVFQKIELSKKEIKPFISDHLVMSQINLAKNSKKWGER